MWEINMGIEFIGKQYETSAVINECILVVIWVSVFYNVVFNYNFYL
jgi:hypothetical protein